MKAMKIMKCAAHAALRVQTELIFKPVHQLDNPAKAFNERFSSCPSCSSWCNFLFEINTKTKG
jgi:hypothetical protein